MRNVSYGLLLVSLGFAAGWYAHVYWQEQGEQVASSHLNLHDNARPSVNDDTSVTLDSWLSFTDESAQERFINGDNRIGSRDDNTEVRALDQRARQIVLLQQFEHWPSYQSWLEAFNLLLPHSSELYQIKANAAVALGGHYIAALEARFLSIELASSFERYQYYEKTLESFVIATIKQFESGASILKNDDFRIFLDTVHEKKPGFPPIHMALARLFQVESNINEALAVLARADRGTVFESQIKALQNRLEVILQSQFSNEGIPLEQYGNQYIATVTINDRFDLRLLIDTGASNTTLNYPITDYLLQNDPDAFMDTGKAVYISTANGVSKSRAFQISSLSIARYRLQDVIVFEANMASEDVFDGLLGMDFLSAFNFRIDQNSKRLLLKLEENIP